MRENVPCGQVLFDCLLFQLAHLVSDFYYVWNKKLYAQIPCDMILKQWKFDVQPTKFYSYQCCKILFLLAVVKVNFNWTCFFACQLPLTHRLKESFWSKTSCCQICEFCENVQCCCMSQAYFWEVLPLKTPLYSPNWYRQPTLTRLVPLYNFAWHPRLFLGITFMAFSSVLTDLFVSGLFLIETEARLHCGDGRVDLNHSGVWKPLTVLKPGVMW